MYTLEIRPHLDALFKKMSKKNQTRLEKIHKKVQQILENPQHFKPLHAPMQGLRRVHVDSSFVLTYSTDEKRKTVILEDVDHHDTVYR